MRAVRAAPCARAAPRIGRILCPHCARDASAPPSFGKGPFTIRDDFDSSPRRYSLRTRARGRLAPVPLSVHLSRLCDDPPDKGSASVVWRVWSDVSLFAQIRAFIEQLVHVSARRDPLTAARHRAFIAPRLIGGLLALTALPVHLARQRRAGPARDLHLCLARDAASDRLLSLAHRALRARADHVVGRAGRPGRDDRRGHRRHHLFRRRLARGHPARGRACGVAPRRDRRVACSRSAAAAFLFAGQMAQPFAAGRAFDHAGAARARLRGALCGRPCARQRLARARKLAPARGGGGPLPAARAQHRRRHHAPSPRRHGALRLARRGAAVRRAAESAARARPVRPRACRRPAGLSDRAVACGDAGREQLGRIPHPPRSAGRGRGARRVHLGRHALPSARPRRRERRRARSRRRDPRRDRAQDAGAGARQARARKPSAPTPPRAASSRP